MFAQYSAAAVKLPCFGTDSPSRYLLSGLLGILGFGCDTVAEEKPLVIGIEYAMPGMAKAFGELGVPAVKPLAEPIAWGKMQKTKEAPIDFSRLDDLVREYQEAGFTEMMVDLRSLSPWATPHWIFNQAPKAEFLPLYDAWIRAIVERYDKDGIEDMPGLKYPVRYYEIGTEFSSYEPEPVADYLLMLEHAYKAAHQASNQVIVLHAAFLTTTAFNHHPQPSEYAAAFAAASPHVTKPHGLSDMRAVLDRPEWFDAVNCHALEDPLMIEDIVGWLRWEMKQRHYQKPIIISDTMPSSFIAWGPATRATGPPLTLGIVIPPATEADRPRLAEFFTKLVDGDKETTAWVHTFVATDLVEKVVIAAEQQVALINTSFMEDLFFLKLKFAQAGAGVSAWAGMAEVKINVREDSRTVTGLRPAFYAVKQIQQQIRGYHSVQRVRLADPQVRLYKFARDHEAVWIAWLEPTALLLPADGIPTTTFSLPTRGARVTVENMQETKAAAERNVIPVTNGVARITLTPHPIYLSENEFLP